MTQSQINEAFLSWAKSVGMVMDSEKDHEDFKARGYLFSDPGADVHDCESAP